MAVPGQDTPRLGVRREVRHPDHPHGRSPPRATPTTSRSSATASRSTPPTTASRSTACTSRRPRRASSSSSRPEGIGEGTITYRIRDWLFSRQRYWGEPFPIMFDEDGVAYAVPDDELPLTLPDVPDYSPKTFDPDDAQSSPEPPLSRVPEWVEVEQDLGDGRGLRKLPPRDEHHAQLGRARAGTTCATSTRRTTTRSSTRPTRRTGWAATTPRSRAPRRARATRAASTSTSAASSTRCCTCSTPASGTRSSSTSATCSSEEPFRKYFSQGYIQAYAYTDSRGQYVTASEVEEHPGSHGASRPSRGRASPSAASTARSASR